MVWPIDLMGTGDISEDFAPLLSLKFFVTVMEKLDISIWPFELQGYYRHNQIKETVYEADKTFGTLYSQHSCLITLKRQVQNDI